MTQTVDHGLVTGQVAGSKVLPGTGMPGAGRYGMAGRGTDVHSHPTVVLNSVDRSPVLGERARRSKLALLPLVGFVYILFRPVSNGRILLPILFGLALCGLIVGLLRRHRLALPLLTFFLIQLSFGLFFGLVGRGNAGVDNQILTFVGFPLVFWLIVYGISEKMLSRVIWAAAIGCTLVATTIILFVGAQLGPLPHIIPSALLQTQSDAFYSGGPGAAVRFYGLATLAAGAPLWVASILIPRARLLPPMSVRLTAAVTCSLAALVAGRQAILLTTILTPVFLWIASALIGRYHADRLTTSRVELTRARHRRLFGIVAAIAGVLIVGSLSFNSTAVFGGAVPNAFRSVGATYLGTGNLDDVDTEVRQEESRILLAGFRDHPLLGSGLGASFPDYRRDEAKPWNFELQYHMLLFDTGLVGVLFALAAAAVLIYSARRAVLHRPDLAGCLTVTTVGCLGMLAASASNPYLQAPGYNWALYLPIVVINVALTSPSAYSRVRT